MTHPIPLPEAAPPPPSARSTVPGIIAVGVVLAVSLLALWPRYTPSARDPRLVAVLPFHVVTEDSALAVLSEGMVDLFDARLTGEQGFRTLAPVAAIRAWRDIGGQFDTRVPEPQALEIAARMDAAFLLLGTITDRQARLEVQAALLAVPDGRILGQFRTSGPADSLTRIVDELVTRFVASRRAAGVEPGTPLPATSRAAIYAWLEGRSAYRDGRFDDASLAFARALGADSVFPLAGLWAAMTARRLGIPVTRLPVDTTRLAPRDRALYRALLPAPDVVTEYRRWRAADSLAVRRPEPPLALAELLLDFGPLLDPDSAPPRAFRESGRAREYEPEALGPVEALIRAAAQLGDTAGLRRAATRLVELDSAGDRSAFGQWILALTQGDIASASRLRRRFADLSSGTLLRILGSAQVTGLGLDDAEAAAAVLVRRQETDDRAVAARIFHYHRNRGRLDDAARFRGQAGIDLVLESALFGADLAAARDMAALLATGLAPAPPAASGPRLLHHRDLCTLAVWEATHGEAGEASALLARLAALDIARTAGAAPESRGCEAVAEGLLAVREGRPLPVPTRAALDSLHGRILRRDDLRVAIQLVLAWGDEVAGDPAAALRRLPVLGSPEAGPAWLADLLRERGRLARLAGEREAAVQAYEHYLRLRSAPVPALAEEVAAVRRALAELLAGG
jgi:TolB-like protein